MLKIVVPGEEFYNEVTQEFIETEELVLELEHCLAGISKWESKFEKPFLAKTDKTHEETLAYIRYMIVSPEIPPQQILNLSTENFREINDYINSKQSATTFREMPTRNATGEVITSELIYYWMVAFNIPFECQYWHLNRLFSLIQVCNVKNSKPKKMSRHEIAARNRELNAKRRAELNTSG